MKDLFWIVKTFGFRAGIHFAIDSLRRKKQEPIIEEAVNIISYDDTLN